MTDNKGMIVIGSGGQALVVIGTCRAAGIAVEAVYDDDPTRWGKDLMGVPILGPVEEIRQRSDYPVVIGVGDARSRRLLANKMDLNWGTVVHPHAFVDPSVQLGAGTVVFAGAMVQPESRIGDHAIINTSATVDHNCILEDYVQVAPGANLSGNVWVGAGTFVGANAVVLENLRLGKWSIIGGGAVVIRDLPDHVVAVGCPARTIRTLDIPEEQAEMKRSKVHSAAESVIHRVLADSGREVRPLSDDDTLAGTLHLDSLDLAVTVVALEQELGVDPLRDGAAPVRTFGQLVALYERACGERN